MRKQGINTKRRKLCQNILNQGLVKDDAEFLTVRSAFMNGSLPHGVALAWVGERDAYLVNLRKKTYKEYVRNGRFLMHRAFLPVKIWVEKEIREEKEVIPTYDLSYLKDGGYEIYD
jgi:hypothetical protein